MPEVEARSRAVTLAQSEPLPPVMPETPKPVTPPRPPQPRSPAVLPPPPPPPRGPARSPALPPPQPASQGQDVTAPLDLSFEAVLDASLVDASAGTYDIEQMMMSLASPEIHSDNAVGDREEMLLMQSCAIMDATSFPPLPKTPDLPNIGTLASSPLSVDLVTPTSKLERAAIDAATAASLAINIPSVQPTPEPDEPRPSTSRQPDCQILQVEVDKNNPEACRLFFMLQKMQVKKR